MGFRRFKASKASVLKMIAQDKQMMQLLMQARALGLPQWWIGAGFVRNKVWNALQGSKRTPRFEDLDLIYFDRKNLTKAHDKKYETRLGGIWSVKNQARMHVRNGDEAYRSSSHAIRFWPETCTALGVRLLKNGRLILTAPHGLEDLFTGIIRPTPHFKKYKMEIFRERQKKKNWKKTWSFLNEAI